MLNYVPEDEPEKIELDPQDFDALVAKLNEPPKVLPNLQKLMQDGPDGMAFNPLGDSPDIINNPSHYNRGGIEIINVLKAFLTPEEYKGYLKGTNLTYLLRSAWKGQNKHDILKAEWYAKRLSDEVK